MQGVGTVRIRVLGALAAEVNGVRVSLGGPRQRGVLGQLLVADGAVVAADRLVDGLWGGRPPAKAAASLQAYISNLRRVLEPERGPREPARVLVSEAPGYALRLPATGALDARDFERLVARARKLRRPGPVREALELWDGEAYAEFADQPWALREVARLNELRLGARELAVVLTVDQGDFGAAVPEALALTEEHPFREEGWRLLALALWSANRQAEALDALRRARTLLATDLGLDLGPALAELESAILNQRTELIGAPAPQAVPLPQPELFVGRADELRVVREAAAEAVGGARAVVLISGEAGAGKSTLLQRLRSELAAAGWLVASGRCPETEGAPPAWAWTEALRELAGQVGPGPAEAEVLAPLLEAEEYAARRGSDPLAGRFRLHRAVADWLRRAAADRPVAVVLDDLHAADQETRALLAELSTGPVVPGLLLIVAHRPGEGDLTDTLAQLARLSPRRLPLSGLAEAEAGRLIAAVCPTGVDRATVAALAERTGGNPFYLRESARLLAGEGALVAVTEVPQGVGDVLRRRFGVLPADAVEVLRLAAVVGREAEVDLLLAAADRTEDQVLAALETALNGGLLTEPGPGVVRFTHALVRDTLYSDLSGLRRARLHGRVGAALAELRPGQLSALAHHFTRAASAATAQAAVEHCVRAAEAAERRYAHETCAALFQQALANLELVPAGDDDRPARRIELLGALLRAQVRAGAITAALATRSTAVALAKETGRSDLAIAAWTSWTVPTPWVAHAYGTIDHSAVATLTGLLELPDLTPATRCHLLDALTYELDCSGSPEGWAAAEEAVAIARAERDPVLLAHALAAQARVHDYELEIELRVEIAAELAAVATEHDLPAYRWQAEHLFSTAAAVRGDPVALREHIRAGLRIAETYHLSELVDVGRCQLGMLALIENRPAEADAHYQQALDGLFARESLHAAGFAALHRITIAIQRGTLGSELALIEQAGAAYGAITEDVRALALIELGRPGEARAARVTKRVIPPDYYRSFFLAIRAMAVIALDERAEAEDLFTELLPLRHMIAGVASTSIALRPVALTLGDLSHYLGHPDAADHYHRAATLARRWNAPHWEAEALSGVSRQGLGEQRRQPQGR
ncbi:DNA-binding SARP family transcriptional activator [Kitasatospora gansuensis]|uniref:DNA-binding SARP family transcriptional activator n=1 Tax=Kitasatospora gansuensis TaxID=258050 RepID=A0A7W7S887_9ACTN|nr:BTAD domain-containing putative transcriptional regulator [Kitasatospora gansuensis]MBB4945724.1 DNA-binding SARP family transcriptional activator [Kitasatospora gansuensis]